jgi:hypothetical protein
MRPLCDEPSRFIESCGVHVSGRKSPHVPGVQFVVTQKWQGCDSNQSPAQLEGSQRRVRCQYAGKTPSRAAGIPGSSATAEKHV